MLQFVWSHYRAEDGGGRVAGCFFLVCR